MSERKDSYLIDFSNAFKQNLNDMAFITSEMTALEIQKDSLISQGVAVLIGITGKHPGRIIFDTSLETATELSRLINEENNIEQQLVLDTMSEFANIVSGHTTTLINNANKTMGLMLTPPSIFFGDKITISSPKINAHILRFNTEIGNITVSIGFEGGI